MTFRGFCGAAKPGGRWKELISKMLVASAWTMKKGKVVRDCNGPKAEATATVQCVLFMLVAGSKESGAF